MFKKVRAIQIPQDAANDLASVVRARDVARFWAQSWLLSAAVNNVEVTEEKIAPFLQSFNQVNKALYSQLWNLYNAGYGERPGKAPEMRYSATVRCDTRCTHASGTTCVCGCGGINHATFYPGSLVHCADPAAELKRIKAENATALKEINDDPVKRLLHIFGVKQHKEKVAARQ